ncbi:hypothetical protein BGZ76_008301 [Entomortierella beljakovae]|nr:hypothetical protein BGZ76_008301 [Entomortierella beljakovae]
MTDASFNNTLAAMIELVISTAPAIGNLFSDAATDDSVVIYALRGEYKAMQINRASCRKVIMAVRPFSKDTTLTAKSRSEYVKNIDALEKKCFPDFGTTLDVPTPVAAPAPFVTREHTSSSALSSDGSRSLKFNPFWPTWAKSNVDLDDFLLSFVQAIATTNDEAILMNPNIYRFLSMAIRDDAKRRLFVSRSVVEKAANWEAASAIFRNVCRTTSDMVKVNEELLKITIGQKEMSYATFADRVSTRVC